MGVGVQREGRIGVTQDSGQRFGIHAAGEGMGREGVAQVVEADAGQPRPLEQRFHVAIGCIGVDGIFRLHRVREYPLADGILTSTQSMPFWASDSMSGRYAVYRLFRRDRISVPLSHFRSCRLYFRCRV